MHRYVLCGLQTHSDIPLTGVPTTANDDVYPHVVIELAAGDPPFLKSTGRLALQHAVSRSHIRVDDVAHFEISAGRRIRVWPAPGVPQKDVEIFLLGLAWATLCHQRGLLPLHASAIATGSGIIGFAGHSGAGKSTAAALLSSLGHDLVTDDILPVSFNRNSIPGAWPYLRRLKLRRDTVEQLGYKPAEIVSERLDKDKSFVRPSHTGDDTWRRLDRLYLLESDVADIPGAIGRVTGAEAVRVLVDQTYHFSFIIQARRFGEHLRLCTHLASEIPIYRVCRSPLSNAEEAFAPLICAHLQAAA